MARKITWEGVEVGKLAEGLRDVGVRVGAGEVAQYLMEHPEGFFAMLQRVGIVHHLDYEYDGYSMEMRLRVKCFITEEPPPHVHKWKLSSMGVSGGNPGRTSVYERCSEPGHSGVDLRTRHVPTNRITYPAGP